MENGFGRSRSCVSASRRWTNPKNRWGIRRSAGIDASAGARWPSTVGRSLALPTSTRLRRGRWCSCIVCNVPQRWSVLGLRSICGCGNVERSGEGILKREIRGSTGCNSDRRVRPKIAQHVWWRKVQWGPLPLSMRRGVRLVVIVVPKRCPERASASLRIAALTSRERHGKVVGDNGCIGGRFARRASGAWSRDVIDKRELDDLVNGTARTTSRKSERATRDASVTPLVTPWACGSTGSRAAAALSLFPTPGTLFGLVAWVIQGIWKQTGIVLGIRVWITSHHFSAVLESKFGL
ncbi:hypothetical protein R3P38DRAFT_3374032 [Favolaschia claudopus]|uniref:Uncharacterized protein n=1 Tax=Favolaschia claudopus TaxID=2862362 RepID=A0AAV9ZQV9_9AGAR